MTVHTYAPNTFARKRFRLWRMDAPEGEVRFTTAIDGDEVGWIPFCAPFRAIRPARLEPLPPDILLLRAHCLKPLSKTTPLMSFQLSLGIPRTVYSTKDTIYKRTRQIMDFCL